MNPAGVVRLRGLPQLGPRVPAVLLPVTAALVGLGLTVVSYGVAAGLAVGIPLAVFSWWVPHRLGTWAVILVIGAGQFTRDPVASWQLFVLLAGLHLLHVLAALATGLPWRSWLQLAVFVRPLARLVAIQVPTQLLAWLVLTLLVPDVHGHRPLSWAGFGLIGAAVLAGLALLLAVPLLVARSESR